MESHSPAHVEHAHPTPGLYLRIALILFVLTALEVLAFEAGRGGLGAGLRPIFEPITVVLLIVLSAAKFALVAMFYMHLKFDHAWFSYVFIGPLLIAIGLAVSLLWLFGHLGTTGGG
jgi:cytochrome c oxidase subunit IV